MDRRLLAGMISTLLPLGGLSAYGGYARAAHSVRPLESYTLEPASSAKPLVQPHEDEAPPVDDRAALALTSGQTARELVVIDHRVPDKHVFYAHNRPGVAVVEIEPSQNGLEQLASVLDDYRDLRALHIVSHAVNGAIQLGDGLVTHKSVKERLDILNRAKHTLTDGADILFYGCDLAAGEAGKELLALVAGATGADVAASDDPTGNVDGDWDLEIRVGDVETDAPFTERALASFDDVLAIDDATGRTIDMDGFPSGFGNSKSYDVDSSGYVLRLQTSSVDGNALYCFNPNGYCTANLSGSLTDIESLTIDFTNGASFDFDSMYIYSAAGNRTYVLTPNSGSAIDTSAVDTSAGTTVPVNFTGITSLTITRQDGGDLTNFAFDDVVIKNAAASPDSDGDLTASATVTEPVNLPYSVDTVGEAIDVFDVTVSDGGTADGLALGISEVVVNVSGTSTDTERAKITWRLNGPDVSNAVGTYNGATDTLTFSGTTVSIADGASEVYTLNAFYNDTSGITSGRTVILSVDGDTDLTVGASGTQMATTSPVTNGSGSVLVDDVGPTVTSVTVPANGTYNTGQTLNFIVNYDENVTINTAGGTPRMLVDVGGVNQNAAYISGSGTSSLLFRYIVLSGHNDDDGIGLTAISPNGGTMRDASGNDAATTLNNVGDLSNVFVDGVPSTVTEVTPVSTPTSDTTPDVVISSTESGTLAVGGSCGSGDEGAISAGNSTITLTQPDNSTPLAPGTYSNCTVTVTDGAGNPGSPVTLTSFTVDTTEPSLSEVTPVSTPGNDTTPSVTINTSEAGALAVDGSCGSVDEGNVSAGNVIVTLTQPDNLTALTEGTYSDCTATVTDAAGNASTPLSLSSFVVDTTAPALAEITAVATPGSDTTPSMTISSDEAGTLAVGGSCGSGDEGAVTAGNIAITLTQPDNATPLAEGTYNNCTATVTDAAGNPSSALALTTFVIDVTAPDVAEVTPVATPTLDDTPDVTISSDEAGTLAVGGSCGSSDEGAIGTGNTTITLTQPDNTTPLAAGTYSDCTVSVSDEAGNADTPVTLTGFTVGSVPGFAKAFAPDVVTFGATSTLTFTLDNTANTVAATSLDFTDNFPAGMTVAATPNASTTCTGGTLTAVAGSGTLSYSGGSVAAGAICTVTVDTTTTASGSYVNTSGDLTSSLGNSGPASDTLTVDAPPAFDKAFAPASILLGDVSTLTFTVDNSGNSLAATGLDFTDAFPAGMTVASPANAVSTCTGGTLTATEGSGAISYTGGSVPGGGGSSCTVQVDVTADTAGSLMNVSGDLTSSQGNSGPASATLIALPAPIFSKAFAPNPGRVREPVTVTYTIDNAMGAQDATGLDFSEALPSGLTVANAPNASTTCTGGTLTASAGGTAISYSGGTVSSGTACAVNVDVQSLTPGSFLATSGDLTSSLGNSGSSSATLVINGPPLFSAFFNPQPVSINVPSTLTFRIDNSGSTVDATGLDFAAVVNAPVTLATPANGTNSCGGALTAPDGGSNFSLSGGAVATGAVCELSVDLVSPAVGSFTVTSGTLSSSLGSSGAASDTLQVVDGADLSISITNGADEVGEGVLVDYLVTVSNPSAVDIELASVMVPAPVGLLNVTWECEPDGVGADCGHSGDDSIVDLVDLPAGTSVSYLLTGTVDLSLGATLDVTGDVQMPAGITDVQPGNNSVTDSDPVTDIVYGSGFEPGEIITLKSDDSYAIVAPKHWARAGALPLPVAARTKSGHEAVAHLRLISGEHRLRISHRDQAGVWQAGSWQPIDGHAPLTIEWETPAR